MGAPHHGRLALNHVECQSKSGTRPRRVQGAAVAPAVSGPTASVAWVLTLDDLHKSYGATRALDGVSLRVGAGEMVGFVGANGAGKSTTMRIAMGLLAADSGTVQWDGRPLDFAVRKRFGYMPEERGLYQKTVSYTHLTLPTKRIV